MAEVSERVDLGAPRWLVRVYHGATNIHTRYGPIRLMCAYLLVYAITWIIGDWLLGDSFPLLMVLAVSWLLSSLAPLIAPRRLREAHTRRYGVYYRSLRRREFTRDGAHHRVDGPAIVFDDGREEWWHDGQRHREGGPAVLAVGRGEWYEHGIRHRVDGPAIWCHDGHEEYWWCGLLHREDGPAVTRVDGVQEYHRSGELDRADGPAIIGPGGHEEYWQDGRRHRVGGPAIVHADGREEFWRDGHPRPAQMAVRPHEAADSLAGAVLRRRPHTP